MHKKFITKDFIQKAKSVHGNKYIYSMIDYVNSQSKVKIICKQHGIFIQQANSHVSGNGCPQCALLNRKRKPPEQFIIDAIKIHGNRYDYKLTKYIKAIIKIEIICSIHGVFNQTPNRHLNGAGCIRCAEDDMANNRRKPISLLIKQSEKWHGKKYDYSLIDYKNDRIKVKIICPLHGVFEQYPTHHIRGVGCPKCSTSKGEAVILKYLNDKGLFYEYQKKFKDSEIPRMKFDFYLPELKLLIEYNGIQHYEPVKHFGGKKKFNKQQIIDEKKRTFAKTNDYTLLEIPYHLTNPIGIINQQIQKCQSVLQ